MANQLSSAPPVLTDDLFTTFACGNPLAWWIGLEGFHPDPADWHQEAEPPHRLHLEKLEGRLETGRDAQDENEEDEG